MRIRVRLPQVQPDQYDGPTRCPQEGCEGRHFKAHGVKGEPKALRDPQYADVVAYRQRCLSCGGPCGSIRGGELRSAERSAEGVECAAVWVGAELWSRGGPVVRLGDAPGQDEAECTSVRVYENVQAAGVATRQ